jgi:hypothetical protein
MIDVAEVMRHMPHFETFCSVDNLNALVERLRPDHRFDVKLAGSSVNGRPIHHVRFGKGTVKALFIGFPHAMEPIGGLTVSSLLMLLQQSQRQLLDADVEWHVVPCIDPDGALLNEAWSLNFTFDNLLKNYYMQSPRDQADMSFPISYKKLVVNQPSQEARVLRRVIDSVRPDFYFSLHNTRFGGVSYMLSRDIGTKYHQELYGLLKEQHFPIQMKPVWKEVGVQFGEGIRDIPSTKMIYDYMEGVIPSPETYEMLRYGAQSFDYLAEIKPDALAFVAELGYLRHPSDESENYKDMNLRWFKLQIDADSKYLATVLLTEWEKVKGVVDCTSPFYKSILGGSVLPKKGELCNGGFPLSRYPTPDALFNPNYDRSMVENDLFNVCVVDSGLYFFMWSYQFLRLLKSSAQTATVSEAVETVERAYERVRAEIGRHIDLNAFETVAYDTLAKVQLGSGLTVLNAILQSREP